MKNVLLGSAAALALLSVSACSDEPESADTEVQTAGVAEDGREDAPSTIDRAEISELIEEAVSALDETQAAITAIDSGDNQEALDALERATGKLEIILAREPNLALAPVGTSIAEYDLLATPEAVKVLADEIEDLTDKGRLQEARRLMKGLASELVVSTSNLPLATYPDAIKRAAALLDEQKPQEAKAVLLSALSTVVVTDTIIPLPIVRAEAEVEAAKVLAAKENRTEDDNKAIVAALADAREQIELARALGYATKKDLDDLRDAIEELEEETKGDKAATSFFDRIEGLFDKALEAVQPKKN